MDAATGKHQWPTVAATVMLNVGR